MMVQKNNFCFFTWRIYIHTLNKKNCTLLISTTYLFPRVVFGAVENKTTYSIFIIEVFHICWVWLCTPYSGSLVIYSIFGELICVLYTYFSELGHVSHTYLGSVVVYSVFRELGLAKHDYHLCLQHIPYQQPLSSSTTIVQLQKASKHGQLASFQLISSSKIIHLAPNKPQLGCFWSAAAMVTNNGRLIEIRLLTVGAWLTFTFISIKNAWDMKIFILTNYTLTSVKHLSATNFLLQMVWISINIKHLSIIIFLHQLIWISVKIEDLMN